MCLHTGVKAANKFQSPAEADFGIPLVPLFDCAKDLKDGFAVLLLAVAHRDLHRAVESCAVLHACNHRHTEEYADGSHM